MPRTKRKSVNVCGIGIRLENDKPALSSLIQHSLKKTFDAITCETNSARGLKTGPGPLIIMID